MYLGSLKYYRQYFVELMNLELRSRLILYMTLSNNN